MTAWSVILAVASALIDSNIHGAAALPAQAPLAGSSLASNTRFSAPKKLTGRFLHITDIHPDLYYKAGTSQKKACHRKKPKKKKNRAGYYGTEYSECDSPLSLVDFTFDVLEKKWASEVDFVVWTGDNARHDNDRQTPRTTTEIYELNRLMSRKMEKVFTKKGIPVVPSGITTCGNIMQPGPSSITNEFTSIWKSFIPFPYHQVFQRGAYFSVEVIPDALAVISLNTMYFYDSNKAVGGCLYNEPDDAGNLQFDWLEVQMKTFRERGLQVWLTGHVPPSSGNFFPECYVRYADISLRYQDTILGHLYGHMNADHFYFIEATDLMFDAPDLGSVNSNISATSSHGTLCDALLDDFANIPKPKNVDLDEFAVINVSPPVVPSPYLPTFRIFSYNITGWDDYEHLARIRKERKPGHHRNRGDNQKSCKKEENHNSWKCHLDPVWHSDPEAPSRANTLWSPLGYAQYYVGDLKNADKNNKPHFRLEYATYLPENLHPNTTETELEHSEMFHYPIPVKNLPKSLRDPVEKSKYLPYEMKDSTVGSWVDLARRLGDTESKKLRNRFRKYMYLGGVEG